LDRHEPKVATETLGVWQAMDGNNQRQIAQLRKKTDDFAECMRTGFLSKNDAWYAITTTIMKTLEYPMTATTIRKKDWECIMIPVLAAGLPRAGLARTFPRDILFGPTTVQGFGMLHAWYHQQILHLTALLEHNQQQTMTGQLLTTSYEQLRLEMRTSGFMTDISYKSMKATVTKTWITDLWEFIDRFQIKLHDDIEHLRLQRKNDKFLMDEFLSAGYDGTTLKELNECRMFLHVVTLSDIVSADGLQITMNAWNGSQDERGKSQYQWPRIQHALPNQQWEQWRRIIDRVFVLHGTPRSLREPLLSWHKGAPVRWKWYFAPQEDRLYAKEGMLWRVYCRHRGHISHRERRAKYSKTEQMLREPPEGLLLASVWKQG
jgi:hypothetical protein